MFDSGGQERTIAATPRRLAEARRRGHFPHSRELTASAVGCGAAVSLWLLGPRLWTSTLDLFAAAWAAPAASMDDLQGAAPIEAATLHIAGLLAGILGTAAATAVIVGLMQQGFRPQLRRPHLAWSLLNPMAGCRRLAGGAGPFRIGQLLVKIAAVCVIAGLAYFRIERRTTWALATDELGLLAAIGRAVLDCGVVLTAALLFVSVADWIRCRRRFLHGLRMTPAEALDEARDSNRRARPRTRLAPRVSAPEAQVLASAAKIVEPLPDSQFPKRQLQTDLIIE